MEKLLNLQSYLTTPQFKSVKVCDDHINVVIDMIVDELETFPIMESIHNGECYLCNKEAKYEVKINED